MVEAGDDAYLMLNFAANFSLVMLISVMLIKNKYVRHVNTAATVYCWDHVLSERYSVGTIEKKIETIFFLKIF